LPDDFLQVKLLKTSELNAQAKNDGSKYLDDQYLMKLFQNEEFLNELRHNKDFLTALRSGSIDFRFY